MPSGLVSHDTKQSDFRPHNLLHYIDISFQYANRPWSSITIRHHLHHQSTSIFKPPSAQPSFQVPEDIKCKSRMLLLLIRTRWSSHHHLPPKPLSTRHQTALCPAHLFSSRDKHWLPSLTY